MGDHDQTESEVSEAVLSVRYVFVHSEFNPSTLDNDIALLQVSDPIEFNRHVGPACLPENDFDSGTMCIASGWGITDGEILIYFFS